MGPAPGGSAGVRNAAPTAARRGARSGWHVLDVATGRATAGAGMAPLPPARPGTGLAASQTRRLNLPPGEAVTPPTDGEPVPQAAVTGLPASPAPHPVSRLRPSAARPQAERCPVQGGGRSCLPTPHTCARTRVYRHMPAYLPHRRGPSGSVGPLSLFREESSAQRACLPRPPPPAPALSEHGRGSSLLAERGL